MKIIIQIFCLSLLSYLTACGHCGTEIGNGCPVKTDAEKAGVDGDKDDSDPNSISNGVQFEKYEAIVKTVLSPCQSLIVQGSPVNFDLRDTDTSLKLANVSEKYSLSVNDYELASAEFNGMAGILTAKNENNEIIDISATCSTETTEINLGNTTHKVVHTFADSSETELIWITDGLNKIIEVRVNDTTNNKLWTFK